MQYCYRFLNWSKNCSISSLWEMSRWFSAMVTFSTSWKSPKISVRLWSQRQSGWPSCSNTKVVTYAINFSLQYAIKSKVSYGHVLDKNQIQHTFFLSCLEKYIVIYLIFNIYILNIFISLPRDGTNRLH
ncbi:Hypothetical_protein [Hexamita inflata]|nr:Hypothetical protein HINF_LOCUS9024 [Hexamita inflata]